jgi:hypothetical protein
MAKQIDITTTVDSIGALKAQIAPLEKALKALQDKLKALGDGRYEGSLYDATVYSGTRETLDQDAVRAKLSPQFIVAHTKVTETVTLKVTAKQLSIAA